MARNWMELGEGPKRAWRGEIYASMNYRGDIVINRYALEEMKHPEAVVLLFDPDIDTIGLRPTSLQTLNAFRLKPKGSSGHRYVSAIALARKRYQDRRDRSLSHRRGRERHSCPRPA